MQMLKTRSSVLPSENDGRKEVGGGTDQRQHNHTEEHRGEANVAAASPSASETSSASIAIATVPPIRTASERRRLHSACARALLGREHVAMRDQRVD